VLSYNDVLLRRADVELLTGPRWLNDQVGFQLDTSTFGHLRPVLIPSSLPWFVFSAADNKFSPQVISFYFEYITQERLQGEQMLLIHFVSQPLTLGNSAAMEASWNFERREERHA
jgi:hypothetical protein